MIRLVVFDLDGTLAQSGMPIDAETAAWLSMLLTVVDVAVISDGEWPRFQTQLLARLPHDHRLRNLSLLPTFGSKFYRYRDEWELVAFDDTARGLERLHDVLRVDLGDMLFVGDAPVRLAGVQSIEVDGPKQTRCVIDSLLACAAGLSVRAFEHGVA